MSDATDANSDRECEVLLAELRVTASRLDPAPPEAVLAARSAFAYRTLDAELAELTADSEIDDDRFALVRSLDTPRLLTFEASGLTVEVEILVDGRRRQLQGQLVPGQSAGIELRHLSGRSQVSTDQIGWFRVTDLPRGPVSLRCQAASGRSVETDWFVA